MIEYCSSLSGVYEDYPFHDDNWTVMRCKDNKKTFAMIYERNGLIWINVKADPEWIDFWRNTYASVIPGYHMNKNHWNSIILDETVPDKVIMRMVAESYDLVRPKRKVVRLMADALDVPVELKVEKKLEKIQELICLETEYIIN